jgi:hypothetical protein
MNIGEAPIAATRLVMEPSRMHVQRAPFRWGCDSAPQKRFGMADSDVWHESAAWHLITDSDLFETATIAVVFVPRNPWKHRG